MEHTVEFRDNQELQAVDFTNMQTWAQEGLDHVVLDTIEGGSAYSGMTISKSATTVVSVAPGRLYSNGMVYASDQVVTLDLFNDLPVATQKQFAIVAWGQTIDEDIQPRNFLIDADTGQAEPQSVAMESTRYCNINYVRGVESANPQFPTVDASTTLIGYVLCDPTGIVSFQQVTDTQVPNLALVEGRVAVLEAWQSVIAGAINTLRTDLANLANQFALYTTKADFQALVTQVTWIYNQVQKLLAAYTFYGTDWFYDTSQSYTTGNVDGVYSANVQDGLRFPGGNAPATTTLQLLNPSEPLIQADSGWTIPKPSGARVRYDCSFPDYDFVDDRILVYTFWSFTCRHLTPKRKRHRCGPPYIVNDGGIIAVQQIQLDPILVNLEFASEAWAVVEQRDANRHPDYDPDWPKYIGDRDDRWWRDDVDVDYWSKNYTNYSHSGQCAVQTFLNAQDGWLSGITVFTSKAAFYNPLNLFIHICDDQGKPDISTTIRRVTLAGADVQACYAAPFFAGDIIGTEILNFGSDDWPSWRTTVIRIPTYIYPIRINFPPVFLKAGQRYAIHLNSTYDFSFSISTRPECYQVHQGHFWYSSGSDLVCWLTSFKSLRFFAHYAVWSQWPGSASPGGALRYEINLQPLQLTGGIAGVDVLAETIEPAATNISYEVQLGGVWVPFASGSDAPTFSGNPALVPFRVVFTGTTDLMPGISFTNNQVTIHGPRATSFHHISLQQTVGSTATGFKVVCRLGAAFNATHHTFTCALHYGSTLNSSPTVTDVALDDGTLQRTFTFAATGQTAVYVELNGTTNDGSLFVCQSRSLFAN